MASISARDEGISAEREHRLRDRTRKKKQATDKHMIVIAIASILLGAALALFVLPVVPISATTFSITQTTVADFNSGFFYHTGLTKNTTGGGDGDGEVRLLTVGISCNSWNPGGTANPTNLPPLLGHAAVQKNGYIYVSGGTTNGSTPLPGVYYSQINTTTNNLGNWVATSPLLGGGRKFHAMVEANNFLYVIGGLDSTSVPTNTVLVASINSDGSLGTWTATTPITLQLSDFGSVVVNGKIYVIGGQSSTDEKTVYYATPSPSTGLISGWSLATDLTNPTSRFATAAYSNTIFIAGGADFGNPPYYPDVYYAIPATSGNITAYTSTIPLNTNLIYGAGSTFAGQLYVAGGAYNNGGTLTNTITSNVISPTGGLSSSWINSDCLSSARQRTAAVMSNAGWLYVIEGNAGTDLQGINPLNTIDYGPTLTPGGTYISSGTFQSSIIPLGGSGHPILSIDWNAFVSSTVTMTLQYRMGNNNDLSDGVWSGVSYAAVNNSAAQTNNVPIGSPSDPPKQFVQYRVSLGTTNNRHSPVLNWVRVNYDAPIYPDFTITSMQAPTKPSSPMTQTITVWVANQGETSYGPTRNNPLKVVTPQPISKFAPLPRKPSAPSLKTGSYISTTNYFFYVDVYVDPVPPPTTVISVPVTPCLNNRGVSNEKPWVYSGELPVGTTMQVQALCWVTPHGDGSANVFYAQVDTCEDLNGNLCSTTYGRILEKSENNNIFGPILSGTGGSGGGLSFFLPFIKRSP